MRRRRDARSTAHAIRYGVHDHGERLISLTSVKIQVEMKEDVFSMHMESAAANKLQPDNTLSEEAQRHWPEIYSRRRAFHVNVAEAAEMRRIDKSAVLQAYEEW